MAEEGRKAIVAFDYEAQRLDELTLADGDLVVVVEEAPDGWVKAKCHKFGAELTGWFPRSYIDFDDELDQDVGDGQFTHDENNNNLSRNIKDNNINNNNTGSNTTTTTTNNNNNNNNNNRSTADEEWNPFGDEEEKNPYSPDISSQRQATKSNARSQPRRMTSGDLELRVKKDRQAQMRRASIQSKPFNPKQSRQQQKQKQDHQNKMMAPSIKEQPKQIHRTKQQAAEDDIPPQLPPRNPNLPKLQISPSNISTGSDGSASQAPVSPKVHHVASEMNSEFQGHGSLLGSSVMLHKQSDKQKGKLRHVFFFDRMIVVCKPKGKSYNTKAQEELHSQLIIKPYPWKSHRQDEKPVVPAAGLALFQRLALPGGDKELLLHIFGIPGSNYEDVRDGLIRSVSNRVNALRATAEDPYHDPKLLMYGERAPPETYDSGEAASSVAASSDTGTNRTSPESSVGGRSSMILTDAKRLQGASSTEYQEPLFLEEASSLQGSTPTDLPQATQTRSPYADPRLVSGHPSQQTMDQQQQQAKPRVSYAEPMSPTTMNNNGMNYRPASYAEPMSPTARIAHQNAVHRGNRTASGYEIPIPLEGAVHEDEEA